MRVMDLINSDAIEHIKHLPLTSVKKVEGLSILTAHGSDRRYNEGVGIVTTHSDIEDLFNRLPTNIMLCGHTHRQYFASDTGKTIINVGSVGSSINKPFAEYAILSLKKNSLSYEFKSIIVK